MVDEDKNLGETAVDRDTEQGFTRGNWRVVKAPTVLLIKSCHDADIAEVSLRLSVRGPNRSAIEARAWANARLIAAAPALYEALRPLANTPIHHFSEGHAGIPSDCPVCGPVLRAMNALALAEKGADESAKRPVSDETSQSQAS